jgi:hypothetical protein
MKFLYLVQLLTIHLAVSLTIGTMTDNLTYRFWTWVAIGIPVNLIIGSFFLSKEKPKEIMPVENEEIFDHLFTRKK